MPDNRLEPLAKIGKTTTIIPAAFEFVDIAGLVAGASEGEGLGNRFLSHIREVDAIVQVVRCFQDKEVVHLMGSVDPIRDIEIIATELIQWTTSTKKALKELGAGIRKRRKTWPCWSVSCLISMR